MPLNQSTLKAVIFDLDDTLYDHLHSARFGLQQLARRYPAMESVSIQELEDRYSDALEAVHLRLLSGEVDQQEARTIRMQQLFSSFCISVDDDTAFAEYRQFRADYDSVCQVVAGSHELLSCLMERGYQLAIMTNNLVSEQIPKLRQLDLEQYFDVVSISEDVGVAKPHPKIFEVTLERLGLHRHEVVMVGDSLASDIAGAIGVGMPTVWLDRRPDLKRSSPSEVTEIVSGDLRETTKCVDAILRAHARR
ncbi:MAG: HAD family hydrolase [Planctomycetales bacterium]|nr:HAD family hydrolase [Planctomycetales bacterium]